MQILIDGYNLSKPRGTGVANYGNNLASIISQEGHQVGILFPYQSTSYYRSLLSSIQVCLNQVPNLKKYKLLFYFLEAITFQYYIKDEPIKTDLVINKESKVDLSQYRFFFKESIFEFAHIFFKLTNQLLPIKVPQDIDIVHWTYPIPIQAINKPNVYTIHDLVPIWLPHTTLDDKEFYINSISKICQKSSKIVAISKNTKKDLCNIFDLSKNKIFVSWQSTNLVNSQFYSITMQEKILESYHLNKQNYFIFVGNIEPKKNVRRLIQAYLVSNVEQPLVIIGSQAWKSEQELAQLKELQEIQESVPNKSARSLNQVWFLDYLSQQDMMTLLVNARALTFPSLYEGFGLPVLEAMELGVPVLTSNTSSLPEVGGDAVIYVDPYNIEDISSGIVQLATNDELCQQLSNKGLARAKNFTVDIYKQRMLELYNSIYYEFI